MFLEGAIADTLLTYAIVTLSSRLVKIQGCNNENSAYRRARHLPHDTYIPFTKGLFAFSYPTVVTGP